MTTPTLPFIAPAWTAASRPDAHEAPTTAQYSSGTPPDTAQSSTGSFDWGSFLGNLVNTGSQIYGTQNAAEAAQHGNQSAINNQNAFLGNILKMYQPQYNLGAGAFGTLGATLGVNGGGKADYSNFLNMPGYQFAVQQGTQAIQRQAAANGSAYTPNTAAAIGQYVTGTAMQDYNTYVNQLMQAGGLGAQANSGIGNLSYGTGANISQLMSNIGQNNAGKYTGIGGTLGANASGIVSGLGNIAKGIGSWFSSGNNGTGTLNDTLNNSNGTWDAGSGVNPWTGQPASYDAGSTFMNSGPTYDPTLGPTAGNSGTFDNGWSPPDFSNSGPP